MPAMCTQFMHKVEVAEQQAAMVRLHRQSLLPVHRIQQHVQQNNCKRSHQVKSHRILCNIGVNHVLCLLR